MRGSVVARDNAFTSLILRITTTALLGVSILLMVKNKLPYLLYKDQNRYKDTTFKDIDTFSYFVAAMAIVGLYSVLQIGPAVYTAITRKLLFSYPFAMYFNLVLDQVSAYLSVSSASSALAAAIEMKRIYDQSPGGSEVDSFFVKVEIAATLAIIASVIMMVLSLMAAHYLFKN